MEDEPILPGRAEILDLKFYKTEQARRYRIEELREKRAKLLAYARTALAVTSFFLYTPTLQIEVINKGLMAFVGEYRGYLIYIPAALMLWFYHQSNKLSKRIKDEIDTGGKNVI